MIQDTRKGAIFITIMPISSSFPMFDHLLESSRRDDSNKWSSIGFGEEMTPVESIKINLTHLFLTSDDRSNQYSSLP